MISSNNNKLKSNIFPSAISKKLFSYQIEHTKNLANIIYNKKRALDTSDTGTGKTYTTIAICKYLNLKPLVICPKSAISTWIYVCNFFNVIPSLIDNYEMVIKGVKNLIEKNNNDYLWNISDNNLIIFDEAHKCANWNSYNGKLLLSSKNNNNKIILLSATIADEPEKFLLFSYILDFIKPELVKKNNLNFGQYIKFMENWLFRTNQPLLSLHKMLYPERASRMRIEAVPYFPSTEIKAIPYRLNKKNTKLIEDEYSKILNLLKINKKQNILKQIMIARQRIEIFKIPLLINLCNEHIKKGFSVIIFVNFNETVKKLAKELNTKNIIYGPQTKSNRDKIVYNFQKNKIRILIGNIKAGGLGLSLHDTSGKHPRISLISPTWNSVDLKQALGRIHRAGAKSKSYQKIIFIAETVEENIMEKIKEKLNNINSINNGDLDLTYLKYEIKPRSK
jgi:superfamily II DNA or RNA helicase